MGGEVGVRGMPEGVRSVEGLGCIGSRLAIKNLAALSYE